MTRRGYIDRSGEYVISPQFEHAFPFGEERIANVHSGDQEHFIDRGGRPLFGQEFDMALNFSEGLAAVKRDQKWGFIDTSSKWFGVC